MGMSQDAQLQSQLGEAVSSWIVTLEKAVPHGILELKDSMSTFSKAVDFAWYHLIPKDLET